MTGTYEYDISEILNDLRTSREAIDQAERAISYLIRHHHDMMIEVAEVAKVFWRSRKMVIQTPMQQTMYDNWIRKLGKIVNLDVDKIDEDVE